MTAARRIPRGPGNVGVVTVTAIRHIEGVVSTNIAAGPEAAIINGVPVSEPMGLARPPADGDRKVRAYSESCEAHAPAPRSPGPISGGGGGEGVPVRVSGAGAIFATWNVRYLLWGRPGYREYRSTAALRHSQ